MIKKILSIFAIVGIAMSLNAATLAEISEGVTYQNLKEKWWGEISKDAESLTALSNAYNSIIAGTLDLTGMEVGLMGFYIATEKKEITTSNASIIVNYATFYFIKNASDEIFASTIDSCTGAKKAYMQIMRPYDIWGVDKTAIINDSDATTYIKVLVKNQGDKSNEDMLKTMVELSTYFGGKGFTNAQAEASRQMAIYYAAIKALEITK